MNLPAASRSGSSQGAERRRRRLGIGVLLGFVVAAQLLCSSRAEAGAWNKPQWGYFLQIGTSFNTTVGDVARFNGSGNRTGVVVGKFYGNPREGHTVGSNTSNYQSLNTDLYWEIALLKRLSLFGDIAFVSQRQSNSKNQSNTGGDIEYASRGIGDMLLGARVAILENPVAFALEARLFVPLGDTKTIIPLGTGDFRGELRLALGKAWSRLKVPVFVEAEVGVMFRGTGTVRGFDVGNNYEDLVHYAPEIVVHGEVGVVAVRVKQTDRLILSLSVDYRGSTRRSEEPSFTLTPETQEITTVNLSALIFIWKGLGLSLRGSQVAEGRRTLLMTSVFGGVFASF